MMKALLTAAAICFAIGQCAAQTNIKITDDLWLMPISENVFMHVSEMQTETFGKVEANGLIYVAKDEAIIMDTPPSEQQTEKLLEWLALHYSNVRITGVVVNHFHSDALGGLKVFHRRGIPSWSHVLTPELLKAKKDTFDVPHKTFKKSMVLKVGDKKVECYYPGEAHTRDNIVCWIEDEKVIFGGCMVKAMNAGKGNLADANTGTWSRTISHVRERYPSAKVVIPGHGAYGGLELLEFTMTLFQPDRK